MHNAPSQHGILGSLGVALKMRSSRSTAPRRDMLADEDARSLGEWYNRPEECGRKHLVFKEHPWGLE
jgi:hypothetical protein